MARKKPLPIIEDLLITDVAAEGKAIARHDDLVIFIPYAVPGDVVDVQVTKKKKSYAEARVVEYKSYSPVRETPFCAQFGLCGGCKWQNLPYPEQLKYKQNQVVDNLVRIGKLDLPEISPILGSKKTTHYRNKLEFTFSAKAWLTNEEMQLPDEQKRKKALGFHIPGCFDKVLHIENCYLQDEISNRIRIATHKYCMENNISYFDLRSQVGIDADVLYTIWSDA